MNILVTGGAGYIGSHTAHLLLERGHKVLVVDNLSRGSERLLDSRASFAKADVRDKETLKKILSKNPVDAVIHFAAFIEVSKSFEDPESYIDNNVRGTETLLDVCQDLGIKKFVFSSTAAVYADPGTSKVTETSKIDPISPYGQTKLSSEKLLASSTGFLNWTILRYFNVAGASRTGRIGQHGRHHSALIKLAAQTAAGLRDSLTVYGNDFPTADGTGVRDYIYIEDLAEIHLLALENIDEASRHQVFNCGYGHGYSVLQVINMMKKVSGKDFKVVYGPRREGDLAEVVADSSKLQQILHWKPQHDDLELICRTAYEWEAHSAKNE